MMQGPISIFLLYLLFHTGVSDTSPDDCEGKETCITLDECRARFPSSTKYVFNCGNDLVCCPQNPTITEPTTPIQPPFPEDCGIQPTRGRILPAEDADMGEFPWIALLQYRNKSNASHVEFLCSASLINHRYVLTAAHCMRLKDFVKPFSVRLGEHDLSTEKDCLDGVCSDPPLNIEVETTISHERYRKPDYKNDIALIRLKKEITFTPYVAPICLPFDLQESVNERNKYEIAGWYAERRTRKVSPDYLQKSKVSRVATEECSNRQTDLKAKPITDLQMCTDGSRDYDVCTGDSGGLLMTLELDSNGKQRMYQVGVVSFGTKPCGSSVPSVYTRVTKYKDWIRRNILP